MGYLIIDHRASHEGLFEADTLYCTHCGGMTIKNPERERERGYCRKCNHYICDACVAISRHADYIHRPLAELKELVATGKVQIIGGTIADPQLLWLK